MQRRGVHRGAAGSAAVAVLAAGALVFTGVIGNAGGPGSANVAQAAERALDPGSQILHMTTRTLVRSTNLADRVEVRETWLGPRNQSGRSRLTAADGTVVADSSVDGSATIGSVEFDPAAAAQAQIAEGLLRPTEQAVVDGRKVERFADNAGTTWDFDAITFAPVQITSRPQLDRGGAFDATTTVTRYERLPATPANLTLLTPSQPVVPSPRVVGPEGDEGPAVVKGRVSPATSPGG